jgi:hypothetical protein
MFTAAQLRDAPLQIIAVEELSERPRAQMRSAPDIS